MRHADADAGTGTVKIVATVSLPQGANGTALGAFNLGDPHPTQFAPFPQFMIEGALNTSGVLCYGNAAPRSKSLYYLEGFPRIAIYFRLYLVAECLTWPIPARRR